MKTALPKTAGIQCEPAKAGAATNLNLVTTSGAIYSFLLTEGKSGQPDLKVYVTADSSAARNHPT